MSAYPLKWPNGWVRTPPHLIKDSKFGKMTNSTFNANWKHKAELSVADATKLLSTELRRLGATDEVISTNIETTRDGTPRSGRGEPNDRGVAVYFRLKGKDRVLACDKWRRVAENIAAIAKHIDALRGQERWGVGTVEQSFQGYTALPAPGPTAAQWWDVLECRPDASLEVIDAQYKRLARDHHPDNGGSHARMATLNWAIEEARKAVDVR